MCGKDNFSLCEDGVSDGRSANLKFGSFDPDSFVASDRPTPKQCFKDQPAPTPKVTTEFLSSLQVDGDPLDLPVSEHHEWRLRK